MTIISEQGSSNCFYFLCVLFAFLMTLWASLEYIKNEDVIEISYRKFNPNIEDGQYPAMSLCFAEPYDQSKFSYKYGAQNITNYDDFVSGKLWDERLMNIHYNNVTIDCR